MMLHRFCTKIFQIVSQVHHNLLHTLPEYIISSIYLYLSMKLSAVIAAALAIWLPDPPKVSCLTFERDTIGRPFIDNTAAGPSLIDHALGSVGDQHWQHTQTGGRIYETPKFGDVIREGGNSFTKVGFTTNEFVTCPTAGTPGSC